MTDAGIWPDSARLSIWAEERGDVQLEMRATGSGQWQVHVRFEWHGTGRKTFDLTSAPADTLEEACADLVSTFDEAGIGSAILDDATAKWEADLDARLAARETAP